MARKIVLKQNGLAGQPDAPTGYKYFGFDGDTASEKTGATVSAIGSGGSSYTVYTAKISQATDSAPTATVFENTTGSTPTWSYDGVGQYTVTLVGFTGNILSTDPAFILIGRPNQQSLAFAEAYISGTNTIIVESYDGTANYSDDLLSDTSFEIRIY